MFDFLKLKGTLFKNDVMYFNTKTKVAKVDSKYSEKYARKLLQTALKENTNLPHGWVIIFSDIDEKIDDDGYYDFKIFNKYE